MEVALPGVEQLGHPDRRGHVGKGGWEGPLCGGGRSFDTDCKGTGIDRREASQRRGVDTAWWPALGRTLRNEC